MMRGPRVSFLGTTTQINMPILDVRPRLSRP